ncbi:MAG: hypothetical protein ACP5IL_01035 [Syntrophobacteraceae bacterium]
MDDVVARIMEIERQCRAEVEQAELECAKRIDAYKRLLEEKRVAEHTRILSSENSRLTQALEEAKKRAEAASLAFRMDSETLFNDPALKKKAKRKIISILLGK